MKVEIDGKEISFGFGLYFLGKAQGVLGLELVELLASLKTRADIVDLMYVSAKTEAYLDDKIFVYSKRDWVDLFINDTAEVKVITDWEVEFVKSVQGLFNLKQEDTESETNLTVEKKK